MITVKQLENNGYKKYSDVFQHGREHYQGTYQKAFELNECIKFYLSIDVYHYEQDDFRFSEDIRGNTYFTARAKLNDGTMSFNTEISVEKQSLKEIEKWFCGLWKKLGCQYSNH